MYVMINTGTTCTATSKSTRWKVTTSTKCTASSGDKVGASTGYAQTDDGNLGLRLKYAYLDYNTFFTKILKFAPMASDKFTFGQQQNPLVDWEENLWGFRYTALTPWNYLSLSSTQVGVSMKGPIKINEKQYADYDFGVYDDASYHALEQSAYKQVMGRVTINPFGAESRYDGLGLTGFYDYGYSNKCTPDTNKTNSTCGHLARAAALAHYNGSTFWGQTWGIIAEWDYGHNAFSSSNLYSGSGPADAIGISTASLPGGGFTAWNKMVGGILNTQAIQEGADLLGHFDIPLHAIYGLRPAPVDPAQHARAEGPPGFHPLRRGRLVASQQVSARGVRFTGHPVLPQPVHLRRKLPGPRQQGQGDAVRGAARHPRVLPEHRVQILATNLRSRCEHPQCSHRLFF